MGESVIVMDVVIIMHGNGNENNSQTFTHAYTNTLASCGKKPKKNENI